jgi:hypothetical protein
VFAPDEQYAQEDGRDKAKEDDARKIIRFRRKVPKCRKIGLGLRLILEDSVHLTAPARDIEYVAALALGWPVKPDKAEATYEHGLGRGKTRLKFNSQSSR